VFRAILQSQLKDAHGLGMLTGREKREARTLWYPGDVAMALTGIQTTYTMDAKLDFCSGCYGDG
jgi:hypothetical protein